MMAAPISPEQCAFVDLVLCTHAHTDHMDPDTLKPLLARNPSARLVAPRAVRDQAAIRSGLNADRLILADAGDILQPFAGLSITATRSAHEKLEVNEDGHHRFLGYGIDIGVARLWHSGDCIPFDGLEQEASVLRPDVSLLPVNGRRPELSESGVPGNFTLDEAIALSRTIGATDMIAHHYGLFDFNTERPEVIDNAIQAEHHLQIYRAKTGVAWELIDG
jgi:L-ascorbate metabolism protein UlaG (beta-lactamase superfamily)